MASGPAHFAGGLRRQARGLHVVRRAINRFERDDAGDWVARLACGHGRHVRHDPPWQERAWVERAEARAARVGSELECVRCDRREIPAHYVESRRTASFDVDSIPAGLLRRHTTKPGVWAKICVTAGELDYRLHAPFHETQRLDAAHAGIVLPGVEHEVAARGAVEFCVAFYAEPRT